ncbi:hypothetical protein Tsubulata_040048, partial [Turnera subulata]
LKSSYGGYNKTPKISQTQKPNYLQFYCHSSDSISTISTQTPFAASYLMNTFGFTSESALRASKYLRLKNARVLGLSVERIITKIEFLTSRGASSRDVVKILVNNPQIFYRSMENHDVVHSDEKALTVLKRGWASFPAMLMRQLASIFCGTMESPNQMLKQTVKELKVMGFDPSKKNFVSALTVKCGQSESKWRKKIDVYKSWGWTEKEIFEIFKKAPRYMGCSEKKISAMMDFFVNKLGWGPSVIRGCIPLLGMSLEKRIIPRDSVIQSLLSRGTIQKKSYKTRVFMLTEEGFLDKYVRCYEFADELLKLYRKEIDKSQLKGGSESVQRLKRISSSSDKSCRKY